MSPSDSPKTDMPEVRSPPTVIRVETVPHYYSIPTTMSEVHGRLLEEVNREIVAMRNRDKGAGPAPDLPTKVLIALGKVETLLDVLMRTEFDAEHYKELDRVTRLMFHSNDTLDYCLNLIDEAYGPDACGCLRAYEHFKVIALALFDS